MFQSFLQELPVSCTSFFRRVARFLIGKLVHCEIVDRLLVLEVVLVYQIDSIRRPGTDT
jgi:hypothetical protein